MGLRGNLSQMRDLKRRIAALPTTVAHDVASRAAPAMTGLTRDAFAAGESVYGDARPPAVGGGALTLRKTGATERELRFVSVGTIVRCVLGPKYARYLIGKYAILPMGALPSKWSARLRKIVDETAVSP